MKNKLEEIGGDFGLSLFCLLNLFDVFLIL